jgi:hypothetical protein
MKRGLQIVMTVLDGEEVASARQLWAQMRPAEREIVARVAAEFVLLREASSDSRLVIAPAGELEAAGLPFALPGRAGAT